MVKETKRAEAKKCIIDQRFGGLKRLKILQLNRAYFDLITLVIWFIKFLKSYILLLSLSLLII